LRGADNSLKAGAKSERHILAVIKAHPAACDGFKICFV
jgi:hypothetical protein